MIFRRAKIRLAISYAAVQLALFAAFGIAIYAYVTTTFDFDVLEGDSAVVTAEAGFEILRRAIVAVFIALVILTPVTSYLLASLAMRPIRASFEAQQRFVDDASHEFRTPLSALQAQLELGLRRPRSSDEYRTILGHSLHATAQLIGILNDLLMLSRGPHDSNIAMREVEIESALAEATELLAPTELVRIRFTGTPQLVVLGSRSMLGRAILNLLSNALRYSPADSVVTVGIARRGGFARISIEDHGVGMSVAEQRLAFDRFWRADTSRASHGRGLGLSIVREIAARHGGRVELESELGIGTIASLELPLSR